MSRPFHLRIPKSIYQEMVQHALMEQPNECCGLLSGVIQETHGVVHRRYPLINALQSPIEFESDPRSIFQAEKDMRVHEWEVLAVYHSHPTSHPVPSKKDLARNYSTEVVNLIISLEGEEPWTRGWWLTAEDYEEAIWTIEPDTESE